jgi:hypothetical protein
MAYENGKFEKKPTSQMGHIRVFLLICAMCSRFSSMERTDHSFSGFAVSRKTRASLYAFDKSNGIRTFSV